MTQFAVYVPIQVHTTEPFYTVWLLEMSRQSSTSLPSSLSISFEPLTLTPHPFCHFLPLEMSSPHISFFPLLFPFLDKRFLQAGDVLSNTLTTFSEPRICNDKQDQAQPGSSGSKSADFAQEEINPKSLRALLHYQEKEQRKRSAGALTCNEHGNTMCMSGNASKRPFFSFENYSSKLFLKTNPS